MKRHYDHIIVLCAFLLLFVNVGFNSTSFAIHQPHIVDLPGVGDVGSSIVVTVRTLVAFIFNLMPGVLCAITGTYTSSYLVMLGMTAVCAVIVVTVYARHIKRTQAAVRQQ